MKFEKKNMNTFSLVSCLNFSKSSLQKKKRKNNFTNKKEKRIASILIKEQNS